MIFDKSVQWLIRLEIYEIIRRRLFDEIEDIDCVKQVSYEFSKMFKDLGNSILIMPGNIDLSNRIVQDELLAYLEEGFSSVNVP